MSKCSKLMQSIVNNPKPVIAEVCWSCDSGWVSISC